MVGAGTHSDGTTSKTFALGDSGGEYKHKLNIEEMPSHHHRLKSWYSPEQDNTVSFAGNGIPFTGWREKYNPAMPLTEDEGGNASHNNIQPYAVVKRWTRTA